MRSPHSRACLSPRHTLLLLAATTVSSHADPLPHYLMSAACAASALYSYASLNNPRMAAIKVVWSSDGA